MNKTKANSGGGAVKNCELLLDQLLQSERKKCYEEVKKNIDKWCLDYLADSSHNLEYNKPTPPIWKYLVKRIEEEIK